MELKYIQFLCASEMICDVSKLNDSRVNALEYIEL